MASIAVEGLSKVFGKPRAVREALTMIDAGREKDEILERTGCVLALRDINLSIASNRIFMIMGLSGSGKSTLVRHLNRLIDPTRGKILFDGEDIMTLGLPALRAFRRRRVCMVFQGFGLMPHRTVLENVGYGLVIRGEKRAVVRETATRWIETVGLKGFENRLPAALSGGMRQRVGLARALAVDTDVILMDEAFSALDPLIRAEMQDLLIELQRSLAKTIVFITHDLDESLRLGAEIAILRDGRLVQVGPPADILSRPADDYVARFVARRAITA